MKSRILIVEDESIVALDIQNRLEEHNFDVIGIVSSGSRAIEKAYSESPDLILMDINLKGSIDGIETASLIKRRIDCPIIFLTAFADEKTLQKAKISDASGYILKPFRENELLITIDLAIKRASKRNRIKQNRNWLYGTLNNIHDAVLTVSDEDRIVFLNKKAEELLEHSLNVGDVFSHEQFIVTFGENTYFEFNKKKIDIEYFVDDITDEEHSILGRVHFIRDISKQVVYDIGLEKARIAAENSNRLKSDFISNVTHELRTPLNTIIGMNTLLSEVSIDKEVSLMHDLIGNAACKLLKQINDILELSEIERGNLKVVKSRFSIEQLISDIVKTFKNQIDLKSLDLIILSGHIPFLVGDKNKIKDIISSLMSNAVKFTKSGKIEISSTMEGNHIILKLKDSGIGLSEDQKKSIFELLRQVDSSHNRLYGGLGLGLSLVKELLMLLNGTIDVKHNELGGCSFTVTIPIEISEDQKSKIEYSKDNKIDPVLADKNSNAYKDLLIFLKKTDKLLNQDNFALIEKNINQFKQTHNIMELNYESQILFKVAIAIKLKNRSQFKKIMDEVINESVDSTGEIYENSYS